MRTFNNDVEVALCFLKNFTMAVSLELALIKAD
jgi:hypothetical protein